MLELMITYLDHLVLKIGLLTLLFTLLLAVIALLLSVMIVLFVPVPTIGHFVLLTLSGLLRFRVVQTIALCDLRLQGIDMCDQRHLHCAGLVTTLRALFQ